MCSILSRSVFNVGRVLYKYSYISKHRAVDLPRIKLKKSFSTDDKLKKLSNETIDEKSEEHNLNIGILPEYQKFQDEDADIILDVDEEQKRLDFETINALDVKNPYEGLNMKRGVHGVFDIEDLVDILRKDKAQNIFVATVPPELSYVDYIVIVTGKSQRHMSALATYIRKAYKVKRYRGDLLPKIEGKTSKDWIAIDLGNIALHIFSTTTREQYDLETLWSVGSHYDKIFNGTEENIEFQDIYNDYLAGFQPANESELEPKSI